MALAARALPTTSDGPSKRAVRFAAGSRPPEHPLHATNGGGHVALGVAVGKGAAFSLEDRLARPQP
jgi:hypothetical protein